MNWSGPTRPPAPWSQRSHSGSGRPTVVEDVRGIVSSTTPLTSVKTETPENPERVT